MPCGSRVTGQQQRAGTVVDAAGLAERHRAIGPHHGLESRPCLGRGLARMFVRGVRRQLFLVTTIASPHSCKRLTDAISASNPPPRRAATALDCEVSAISILRVALDAELLGDVLYGLAVQTRKNPQVVHALEGFGPYETF